MEDPSPALGLAIDSSQPMGSDEPRIAKSPLIVWLFGCCVCCGIAVYAFTRAFVWDEGFHLVAAQMILAGKRPYLDFCFPQTPLNAYWNALWMWVFHQSWRISHIPATLEMAGTIWLLARYLLSRFAEARWRIACALAGVAFFALNATQVQFGPIAQAYAICAFTLLGSFLLTAEAVLNRGLWRSFVAGLAVGVGAASSLLVAPAAPVLLLWLWFKNATGARTAKALSFVAGVIIPFAPVIWLFLLGPHQTFFNVVQYQAIFRRADWKPDTALDHDFDVLTAWFDSGQMFVMGACAIAAVIFVRKHKAKLDGRFRTEYWLAFWIAMALVAYISTAHPTFGRYYIVGMPMFAIVAAPGVMAIGERLGAASRPIWAGIAVVALLSFGLLRAQINELDAATWQRYQDIASNVARVTPRGGVIFADEQVYFLLHKLPPSGLEFSYSHKVDVPPKEAALLHIIPAKQLKAQMAAGVYSTVESCDDDKIDEWNLAGLYKQKKDIGDCSVYWGYQKP